MSQPAEPNKTRKKKLTPEQLIELRRQVGVPDEGPPPEPWSGGRPRKKKRNEDDK